MATFSGQKRIKGKRYNPTIATLIGEKRTELDDPNLADYEYFYERLYRKKTGEFFLCFHGFYELLGAGTPDSKKKIIEDILSINPLTYDEAKLWVQKNLEETIYKHLFHPSISNEKIPLQLKLDKAQITKLKSLSVKYKITMSDLVSEMITEKYKCSFEQET